MSRRYHERRNKKSHHYLIIFSIWPLQECVKHSSRNQFTRPEPSRAHTFFSNMHVSLYITDVFTCAKKRFDQLVRAMQHVHAAQNF